MALEGGEDVRGRGRDNLPYVSAASLEPLRRSEAQRPLPWEIRVGDLAQPLTTMQCAALEVERKVKMRRVGGY